MWALGETVFWEAMMDTCCLIQMLSDEVMVMMAPLTSVATVATDVFQIN